MTKHICLLFLFFPFRVFFSRFVGLTLNECSPSDTAINIFLHQIQLAQILLKVFHTHFLRSRLGLVLGTSISITPPNTPSPCRIFTCPYHLNACNSVSQGAFFDAPSSKLPLHTTVLGVRMSCKCFFCSSVEHVGLSRGQKLPPLPLSCSSSCSHSPFCFSSSLCTHNVPQISKSC